MAMEPIADQLNIETPELVSIELPLAGIGSRFIAILVDSLILGAALILLIFLAAFILPALDLLGPKSASWGIGIFLLILFLLFWGYFALFEAFNNGRTPGKRVARIRVIHQSGSGINFVEALARNLVRIIDYLPGFYGVGIAAMFMSRQSQRLGDMVAGTVVVKEETAPLGFLRERLLKRPQGETLFDFSAASLELARPGDINAVERLLERWPQLRPRDKEKLAAAICEPLAKRLKVPPPDAAQHKRFLDDFLAAEYRRQYRQLY